MKRNSHITLALTCAVLLAASGCTIRLTGSASTTAKGKAVHEGEPVSGDPAHPTVKAESMDDTGKPVHTGTPVVAEAAAEVHIALPVPKLGTGVKDAKKACPNTTEVTNGIDDDCDGQVDENEVGSGPLQITLWWSSPADLDLKVVDPSGKEINYKNKNVGGGFMDKDSRSSCKGDQTIENVYWADNPPKGTYKVKVKYYSYCKDKTKPTTAANVSVSYKGQVLGPFSLDMNQDDEVELLEFNLEE